MPNPLRPCLAGYLNFVPTPSLSVTQTFSFAARRFQVTFNNGTSDGLVKEFTLIDTSDTTTSFTGVFPRSTNEYTYSAPKEIAFSSDTGELDLRDVSTLSADAENFKLKKTLAEWTSILQASPNVLWWTPNQNESKLEVGTVDWVRPSFSVGPSGYVPADQIFDFTLSSTIATKVAGMTLLYDPDKEIVQLCPSPTSGTDPSPTSGTDNLSKTLCEMETIFYNSRVFGNISNSSFEKTPWVLSDP